MNKLRFTNIRRLFLVATTLCAGFSYAFDNIAFYYGLNPPIETLAAFDAVVLHPMAAPKQNPYQDTPTEAYLYVSIGEVEEESPLYSQIKPEWVIGKNVIWPGLIVDQTAQGWQTFFIDNLVQPLWSRGYHGIFLDTMDAYEGVIMDEEGLDAQNKALVHLITKIKTRFPGMKIITNRGFSVLADIHDKIEAVAAESLFQSWHQDTQEYAPVNDEDRGFVFDNLKKAQQQYNLKVISIDYVSPFDKSLACKTVKNIQSLGFMPWVTNGAINMVGMNNIKISPKNGIMSYKNQNQDTISKLLDFLTQPCS